MGKKFQCVTQSYFLLTEKVWQELPEQLHSLCFFLSPTMTRTFPLFSPSLPPSVSFLCFVGTPSSHVAPSSRVAPALCHMAGWGVLSRNGVLDDPFLACSPCLPAQAWPHLAPEKPVLASQATASRSSCFRSCRGRVVAGVLSQRKNRDLHYLWPDKSLFQGTV